MQTIKAGVCYAVVERRRAGCSQAACLFGAVLVVELTCVGRVLRVSRSSLLSFHSQQLRFAAMRSGELLLGKMLVPRWTPQHRRTCGEGGTRGGESRGGGKGGKFGG